jgi:hypothetical protein
VGGIDTKLTCKGTAQGLVSGDESSQTFVDLAVLTLASSLNGLHKQKANSYSDHGHEDQPH